MKDYIITVTINLPITARNDEQASERADLIQQWLKLDSPKIAKWLGDMDIDIQIDEG